MQKMMIEAAINELASKRYNPNVPYGPEEIAKDALECIEAGATIVHFHARDADTGAQLWTDAEVYGEAMAMIRRDRPDALLYPSYPGARRKEERFAHIGALANDPAAKLDLATFDVGATNNSGIDPDTGAFRPAGTYVNSHDDLIYFMEQSREHGIAFSLGVRDVGHMRHINEYLRMGLASEPLVLKIFMSTGNAQGPYPNVKGLSMYLDMIPPGMEAHWFITMFRSPEEAGRMYMLAAAMGGHIRTGLGDTPVIDGRQPTNADLVKEAVDLAHKAGREVATLAEGRAMMGMAA